MANKRIENFKNKFIKNRKIKLIEKKKRFTRYKKKFKNYVLMNWTWPKKVFLAILIIVIIGAVFLYLPISYNITKYDYLNNEYVFYFNDAPNEPVRFNFIDALYFSVSAFTTSGISGKIDVGNQMSFFGQFVIFVLLQIGGFGYGSLFYLLGKLIDNLFNKKYKKSFLSTSLSHIERGGTKISDSAKMIVRIFFIIIFFQLFFGLIITLILYNVPFKEQQPIPLIEGMWTDNPNVVYDCYKNFPLALWKGIFLSGSAINNAGFDLFGTSSLSLFRNDIGIYVQLIVLILFVIGGIGYPVVYDLNIKTEWFFKHVILFRCFKVKKYRYLQKPKLTMFSKICIYSSIIIIVLSLMMTYTSEFISQFKMDNSKLEENWKNGISQVLPLYKFPISIASSDGTILRPFGKNYFLNVNFSIFFNTLSTRSAGFTTINMLNLSETTKWIFIFLMFIGTSPSSTGGGIRITTIMVVVKSIGSWLRGVSQTSILKRNVPVKNAINAFMILTFGFAFVIINSGLLFGLALIPVESNKNFLIQSAKYNFTITDFIFESFSAFGTCGLSSGIMSAEHAKWWMRIPIIILMIVGQLGIGPTLEIFARKVPKNKNTSYVEEAIRLG